MSIETLGEALTAGWSIRARCVEGRVEAPRSARRCEYKASLDLPTLVWTRGAAFPISGLESRLKCPNCGSRRIALMFDLPSQPVRRAGAG